MRAPFITIVAFYCLKRLQSPIHIAAEMGHTEICKLLLAAGADIEQREQGGRTPLYIAARGSFTAIVDMIIKTARLDYPAHVSMLLYVFYYFFFKYKHPVLCTLFRNFLRCTYIL